MPFKSLLSTATAIVLSLSVASPAFALRATDFKNKKGESATKVITRKIKDNVPDSQQVIRRNAKRKKDLVILGNAIFAYRRDNGQKLPKFISSSPTEICRLDAADCKGLVDMRDIVADYLDELPIDPSVDPTHPGIGYTIKKNWKDQAFLEAPLAELGWSIRLQK